MNMSNAIAENPQTIELTAQFEREDDMYVAFCVELDIASQGETIETAFDNLKEAVRLWLSTATKSEIETRLPYIRRPHVTYSSRFEVPYGQIANAVGVWGLQDPSTA